MPGCQAARRCDRPKRPRLDFGPEVPLISMQGKCYEAGHQQRYAGHDKAHCHSGMSWMMRVSARRAFRATMAAQIFKLSGKAAGRPSAVGRPAVAKNFSNRRCSARP
jgi:hypothetical protein